jgi:uncharacterized repeat protein (TIGR01451 family)
MRIYIQRLLALLFAISVALQNVPAHAFSGEDPLAGTPFYHAAFTMMATEQTGFSTDAAASIAWHADYIDSYAYNPLWWFANGLSFDRYIKSLAIAEDLTNVHFDDLWSTAQVDYMWNRYFSGTIAGLLWAAENGDVAAAHNILGISLHAVQDFYSHSSWVSQSDWRRYTWLELEPDVRTARFHFTGAYEEPDQLGHHHGKPAPLCTVLQPVSSVMDAACSGISPLSAAGVCEEWRACHDAPSAAPKLTIPVFDAQVDLPNNWVYFAPAGIALDSRWQSRIGIIERNLVDSNGVWPTGTDTHLIGGESCRNWFRSLVQAEDRYEEHAKGNPGYTPIEPPACNNVSDPLFATTSRRAWESSVQWLQIVEKVMTSPEAGATANAFWNTVKTSNSLSQKTQQFEDLHRLPFQFLSAGTYPPAVNVDPEVEEYFLRVKLDTSSDSLSGTDADIILKAEGQEFVLDYARYEGILFSYNDFENGDSAVYTVGPFASLPDGLELENDAIYAGDFFDALGNDLETIWDDFILFLTNTEDYVGSKSILWTPDQLAGIGSTPQTFTAHIDGQSEGVYDVIVTIRRVSETADDATYEITVADLFCIEESDLDGGTNSDEPFILSVLHPLPGTSQSQIHGPYGDVDSGENRDVDHIYNQVTVPKDRGAISLALTVMESDDEGADRRQELMDAMRGEVEEETYSAMEVLGQSIAADWKLNSIQVVGFSRGANNVRYYGTVYQSSPNVWIDNGDTHAFDWGIGQIRQALVIEDMLYAGRPDPTVTKSASVDPMLPGQPVAYTVNFSNVGTGPARDVAIYDTLPAGFVYTNAPSTASDGVTVVPGGAAPSLSWTIVDLPAETGGSITINGVVEPTLNADTVLQNSVTITSSNDYTPTNNLAGAPINVVVPRISFGAASYAANEDAGQIAISLVLDKVNPYAPTHVMVTSADGSAKAGTDYTAMHQQVTIPAGQSQTMIYLAVTPDEVVELDESLALMLSSPIGGALGAQTQASATIVNDDEAYISIDDVTLAEGTGAATPFIFTVKLDAAVDVSVDLTVNTADVTSFGAQDTTPIVNGALHFDGTKDEQETITVQVAADDKAEFDDAFRVLLSNIQAQGRAVYFAKETGQGVIVNDDRGANLLETGILLTIGYVGDDQLDFKKGAAAGVVEVRITDLATGASTVQSFGPGVVRLVVYGDAGADQIKVLDTAGTIPAELYGGDGNDQLMAGAGAAVLVGGSGQDLLQGGKARNVLIGGPDADDLKGYDGEDILVGGSYVDENNRTQIVALLDGWLANTSYADRVNALQSLLSAATVVHDNVRDTLQGKKGQDWLWADAADKIDQSAGEIINASMATSPVQIAETDAPSQQIFLPILNR